MRWFKRKEGPATIDFGHGYTGRRLIDGSYVLEAKDIKGAIDLMDPHMFWKPSHRQYKWCIAKSEKVFRKKALKAMVRRGV